MDVLKIFLQRYIRLEGVGVDDCVRNCFRLFSPPKESQQIQRIMKLLGEEYIVQNPRTELKSGEAAYYLMIAMFQLQTILYNPKVPEKMTLAQFTRNVAGFNDGADFSPAFLEGIYRSV